MLKELIGVGPSIKTVSLPRSRHPLHVMPTSTGYEIRDTPDYRWDGRQRGTTPFTVLQHTISGAGRLRHEGQQILVRPGETMLLVIPHNHCYWIEAGERWEFFWISMNGVEALRIHELILHARGPLLRLRPQTVEQLAACSLRLIRGEGDRPGAASAIAYEAAMLLFDDVFGPGEQPDDAGGGLARALTFLRANLQDDIGVEQLARSAGLSRAHFSRRFADFTGLPPAEFLTQERMRRAAKLLIANRAMSVKEIAGLCGVADSNYFSKLFRRTYGVSPSEFRTTGMYMSEG